jgi:spermidine synthase
VTTTRPRFEIFLISALILFLELAAIRWFPARVLFLTFFTNTVLLAGFLGMSIGCLAAGHRRNYLHWTPALLALALTAARLVEWLRNRSNVFLDVGNQVSPQLIFFGTDYRVRDPTSFVIPVEALAAFLFVLIAITFVGPGQALGRALARVPDRVRAYTINIAGSVMGITLFAACSWAQLSPLWWFLAVAGALAWFLWPAGRVRGLGIVAALVAVVIVAALPPPSQLLARESKTRQLWSPYYRVDYDERARLITVNLIGHQQMISRATKVPAYALPYLLNRDAGGPPPGDVLVIGAGSGNDVSRALQWGARQVDAVEIDPVIYRLGRENHPDRPYDDPRVHVYLADGRNFLRSTSRRYDVIVYALVDSLVLHSSYSNIRLESYLFTTQAFEDVRVHLKPGGRFVMYNYFRQGWLVARLKQQLERTFGVGNPVLLNLPYRPTVTPDQAPADEFTLFVSGATDGVRDALARGEYWLRADRAPGPDSANGFTEPAPGVRRTLSADSRAANLPGWLRFGRTEVVKPRDVLVNATDDWPFLYLRQPMIPALSVRGMVLMGGLGLLLLAPFVWAARRGQPGEEPDARGARPRVFDTRMFFLGAGFMLIETRAVVQMALLFGGTWTVNSVVFFAVLVMILLANLFVARIRPVSLVPYYVGLAVSLALNVLVPPDAFLGMGRGVQVVAACAITFAPIAFAGVIFAVAFSRTAQADLAFGSNVAGALAGGLAEYSSMVLGFRYLLLVATVFYGLSLLGGRHAQVSHPVRVGEGTGGQQP